MPKKSLHIKAGGTPKFFKFGGLNYLKEGGGRRGGEKERSGRGNLSRFSFPLSEGKFSSLHFMRPSLRSLGKEEGGGSFPGTDLSCIRAGKTIALGMRRPNAQVAKKVRSSRKLGEKTETI